MRINRIAVEQFTSNLQALQTTSNIQRHGPLLEESIEFMASILFLLRTVALSPIRGIGSETEIASAC